MQEGRSKEIVHLVQIKTIQIDGREIKLTFSPVPGQAPLVNDALWKLRGELDIADFEFSRNHWAIKDRDLFLITSLVSGLYIGIKKGRLTFYGKTITDSVSACRLSRDLARQ